MLPSNCGKRVLEPVQCLAPLAYLFFKQSPRTPSLGNFKYKQIQSSWCPYLVEEWIRFKQTLVSGICREVCTGI